MFEIFFMVVMVCEDVVVWDIVLRIFGSLLIMFVVDVEFVVMNESFRMSFWNLGLKRVENLFWRRWD